MNYFKLGLTLLVVLALVSTHVDADINDAGSVNKIIGDIDAPIINPNSRGTFSFAVYNPEVNHTMENVRLNVSIYHYSTIEDSIEVSDMEYPPIIEVDGVSVGSDYSMAVFDLAPNETHDISFDIIIGSSTPHGGRFTQSTYFVRFWSDFEFDNNTYTMLSRGYISDDDWYMLSETETDGSGLNRTYMTGMGFDGLLPDSSFTVYTPSPLPIWPYYLLIAITIFVGLLAVAFYIMDNPGKYPRLEKRFQKDWGKFNQFRRLQKSRLGRTRRKVDVTKRDEKGA